MSRTIDTARAAVPGLLLSATIALAVRFVSDRLGGPAMLYALLFGMAFNFPPRTSVLQSAFVLPAATFSDLESRYSVYALRRATSWISAGR